MFLITSCRCTPAVHFGLRPILQIFFFFIFFLFSHPLLLPLSSSPQRWDSADGERDQPRNHPRTEDQGQVRAGGILSCEYWCKWHTHTQTKQQSYVQLQPMLGHTHLTNYEFKNPLWQDTQDALFIFTHTVHTLPDQHMQTNRSAYTRIRHAQTCASVCRSLQRLLQTNATSGHTAF